MERSQAVRPAIGGLLALALVVGALLARGGIEEAGLAPTPSPTPPAHPKGSWRSLPAPPVGWAGPPRVVWTGSEALVWATGPGGAPLLLAYDPERDRWREAARPPLKARSQAVVVWTDPRGDDHTPELVVWGGLDVRRWAVLGDGAAYDPAADRWRRLPDAPLAPRAAAAAAWNGSELLVAGGVGDDLRRHDGAAYDPVADAWRPLGGLPPAGRLIGHTSLGERRRLALVAARGDRLRLLRYNHRRDRWRVEDLPLDFSGHRTVTAADGRLVVWGGRAGGGPAGIVWEGPRTARSLAAPLAPRSFHAAAWTGEHVVVWGGYDASGRRDDGAALDPETGTWRPLARAPLSPRTLPGAVWTGEELLVIGGTTGRGAAVDAAAWRPDD